MLCTQCSALLLDEEIEQCEKEGIIHLCGDCFYELEEDELEMLKKE